MPRPPAGMRRPPVEHELRDAVLFTALVLVLLLATYAACLVIQAAVG